nr:hypothetical protein BaRGS_021567 [Batillaria attramentaria]
MQILNARSQYQGWTAVHVASENGHVNILRLLVQRKADINARSFREETPDVHPPQTSQDIPSDDTRDNKALKKASQEIPVKTASQDAPPDPDDEPEDAQPMKTASIGVSIPLHEASKSGHIEIVELFLKRSFDVNAGDNEGQTPVHLASANGHLRVLKLLLKNGFHVDVADSKGRTPLMLASAAGYLEIVQELIKQRAEVKAVSYAQQTALSRSCENGFVEIFKMLLQYDTRINREYGLNKSIHYYGGSDHVFVEKATLLFIASYGGFREIVTVLLNNNASVDTKNTAGDTALGTASYKGRKDLVELLLSRGATADTKDQFGRTPFFKACARGHKHIAELLLKLNVSVNTTDIDGDTPFAAACYSSVDVVEMLLKLNPRPDIEIKGQYNQTPLLVACYANKTSIVRVLLDHGAQVNVVGNLNGYTPLLLACQKGNAEVLKMLLQRNAHMNVSTSGHPALLYSYRVSRRHRVTTPNTLVTQDLNYTFPNGGV